MDVFVDGPARARACFWRQRTSELFCTVVAKLTYELRPGECELVANGDPIFTEEQQDPAAPGSIRATSDLVPFKPWAEATVVGCAFAPRGMPATHVACRLVAGSIDKMVEAWAGRTFGPEGGVLLGSPQARFPLDARHAAGGPGTDNPSGVETGAGGSIPSLQPAGYRVAFGEYTPSVTFGPIASTAPSRARLLRSEDRAWLEDRERRPVPSGFDATFHQSAPADQRREWPFAANERLILENLHPEIERLVTNLPGVAPHLLVLAPSEEVIRMTGDTLAIDAERGRVTLTFRAQVRVPARREDLQLAIKVTGAADDIGFEALRALRAKSLASKAVRRRPAAVFDATAAEPMGPPASALPFAGEASTAPRSRPAPPPDGALPFGSKEPSRPPSPSPPPPAPAMPALVHAIAPASYSAIAPASFSAALPASFPAIAPAPAPAPASAPPPARKPFAWASRASAEPAVAAPAPFLRNGALELPKPAIAEPALAAEPPSAVRPASAMSARAVSDLAAEKEQARAAAAPARASTGASRRNLVDLLHVASGLLARLDKERALLEAAGLAARRSQEGDVERQRVLRVLSCAQPADGPTLRSTIDAALADPDRLELPLVLVEGEVRPVYDDNETLRLTIAAAQPFATMDKRLAESIKIGQDMLSATLPPQRESMLAMARQIEQGVPASALPSKYLAQQVQRALLEQRAYKKRSVFGSQHVRVDLLLARSDKPLAAYVDAAVAEKLPLLPSLSVLALGELRPREDAGEPNPEAFAILALGRKLEL